ncbi:MAG: histone acetyltransferase [Verrucomicrobia bacterium]|nr:MAG: histone acetyltransferase [Verrucomicrobiota bacterium]
MILEHFPTYSPHDFVFKIAKSPADLAGFFALRREIFCHEQQIFTSDDCDLFDTTMIPIVCKTLIAGMEDSVAGVVRIDQRKPGVWHGSRLGVATDYRRIRHFSPSVAIRNHQPCYHGLGALGAGLIHKAVSTARALGCHEFHATVQHQNARFFQRLHWQPLEEISLHGIPHVRMRADLDHYPPAAQVA